MSGAGCFLGIDLGTSGLKLALVREDGQLVAEGEASYRVNAARAGWAETEPADWWSALQNVVTSMSGPLGGNEILGIGLAGQMHGVVLCDGAGAPLRPAILWPDRRAEPEMADWRALSVADRERLANPIVPGMYGPLLGWLARHEPAVVDRAEFALLPKDVVRASLTGAAVTDRSDASATLLWDVVDDGWSRGVAGRIGIPERLLPEVVPSDTVVGETSWLAQTVDGGPDDVPVVTGGGDTPVAMLAAGTDAALQLNFGTGAQVVLAGTRPSPVASPVTHLFADVDRGWYAMAAVQNAGLAIEWVRKILGLTWRELTGILAAPPSTRQAVSFLPFLTGERGGLAQPGSRGAWVGLEQATSREDMARAALEALAFTVRRAVELLPSLDASSVGVVRLTGGGAREPSIQQLMADVTGMPMQRVEVRSSSAGGAAMLAARGLGRTLHLERSHGPVLQPRASDELEAAYRRWLDRVSVSDA